MNPARDKFIGRLHELLHEHVDGPDGKCCRDYDAKVDEVIDLFSAAPRCDHVEGDSDVAPRCDAVAVGVCGDCEELICSSHALYTHEANLCPTCKQRSDDRAAAQAKAAAARKGKQDA